MKKVTIRTLQAMKEAGERITMLTAYDATFAKLLDAAGVDTLLVGDSLGMVVQGHPTTLPVTMDQMVYHTAAVTRAVERAHVIGDMPFMSYQASVQEAVHNAGRLVAEGRAEAVKLEGGSEFAEIVSAIVRAGIPVMGHIGLTPQSVHKMGGYVVQGKDSEKAQKLFADAVALERAGAYAVVLEGIPMELAEVITRRLRIPTIGIGAGPSCDGQVLVSYDLLGLNPEFQPRFVKRFAELGAAVKEAAQSYASEVKQGKFPSEEHSFRSRTLRLVPAPADTEEDGKTAIYGAPV